MGGSGSGRMAFKSTTDDMRSLDIRRIVRAGRLREGHAFNWQWIRSADGTVLASIRIEVLNRGSVYLFYKQRGNGEDWREVGFAVGLDWTGCNYGAERPWWRCPARGCGRRVAVLYGGAIFACRHCHKLAFPSQRETPFDRAIRKAEKNRAVLGWPAGIANGAGPKPKGMHWKTYRRLRWKAISDEARAMDELSRLYPSMK